MQFPWALSLLFDPVIPLDERLQNILDFLDLHDCCLDEYGAKKFRGLFPDVDDILEAAEFLHELFQRLLPTTSHMECHRLFVKTLECSNCPK